MPLVTGSRIDLFQTGGSRVGSGQSEAEKASLLHLGALHA